jgi:hypothetical protein
MFQNLEYDIGYEDYFMGYWNPPLDYYFDYEDGWFDAQIYALRGYYYYD